MSILETIGNIGSWSLLTGDALENVDAIAAAAVERRVHQDTGDSVRNLDHIVEMVIGLEPYVDPEVTAAAKADAVAAAANTVGRLASVESRPEPANHEQYIEGLATVTSLDDYRAQVEQARMQPIANEDFVSTTALLPERPQTTYNDQQQALIDEALRNAEIARQQAA